MANDGVFLTLTQGLQMVALTPCIMVVIFLLLFARQKFFSLVPVLYFIALSAGFIYQLYPAFSSVPLSEMASVFFVSLESLLPALSYLLVFQFVLNAVPPLTYWMILCVPLFGSSFFIYAAMIQGEMCFTQDACVSSEYVLHLNNVIVSAVIFMLLIVVVSRSFRYFSESLVLRRYKYWIIVSLVLFNLLLLLMDILVVKGSVTVSQYDFSTTMIKLGFIYIVVTSIFRVFPEAFDIPLSKTSYRNVPLGKNELEIAKKIEQLLTDFRVYAELGFSRARFAERLGIREHNLSRIVNLHFGMSVSELANRYRIQDAKDRLETTSDPITVISFEVGFSSITSFNRVFKGIVGVSPSAYRVGKRCYPSNAEEHGDRKPEKDNKPAVAVQKEEALGSHE